MSGWWEVPGGRCILRSDTAKGRGSGSVGTKMGLNNHHLHPSPTPPSYAWLFPLLYKKNDQRYFQILKLYRKEKTYNNSICGYL